jgi:hypothetical protein
MKSFPAAEAKRRFGELLKAADRSGRPIGGRREAIGREI